MDTNKFYPSIEINRNGEKRWHARQDIDHYVTTRGGRIYVVPYGAYQYPAEWVECGTLEAAMATCLLLG